MAFEQTSPLGAKLKRLFYPLEAGGVQLRTTSHLALTECLVRPLREADWDRVRRYEAWLDGNEILTVAPVDWVTFHTAAILRAGSRSLGLADAVHIASALCQGCTHFVTGDKRLSATYKIQHLRPDYPGDLRSLAPVGIQVEDAAAIDPLLPPDASA